MVGHRYLVAAVRRADGQLTVAACSGLVRPAARSKGWRPWLDSLSRAADGGRIFGAVVVAHGGQGPGEWTSVRGVKVTADGPGGRREAVTDVDGEFAFSSLLPGTYRIAVDMGCRSDLIAPAAVTATLAGDHAAADVAIRAHLNSAVTGTVSGRVVDEAGRPVAKQTLRLTVAPSGGDPERSAYWLATTDAEGRYTAFGVRPGR